MVRLLGNGLSGASESTPAPTPKSPTTQPAPKPAAVAQPPAPKPSRIASYFSR